MPALILAGLIVGCNPPGGTGPGPTSPTAGKRFDKLVDLAPDADFGSEAKLVLSGTDIPVQVKTIRKAPELAFEFISHDQTIEVERYRWSDTEFSLVEATTETYAPPMPLLKFPMRVGDEWTWVGELKNAAGGKPAKAVIKTSVAQAMAIETVGAEVKLTIDGGGTKPSERTLKFFFAPGKGLVRREFGFATTREPMEKAP